MHFGCVFNGIWPLTLPWPEKAPPTKFAILGVVRMDFQPHGGESYTYRSGSGFINIHDGSLFILVLGDS